MRSMRPLVRGVALGGAHVIVRCALGVAVSTWPLHSELLRNAAVALLVVLAVIWGLVGGGPSKDAHAEGFESAGSQIWSWTGAGLIGGVFSGVLIALLMSSPRFDLDGAGILFELTSGIAWTFLLILLPAMVGVAIANRWRRLVWDRRNH